MDLYNMNQMVLAASVIHPNATSNVFQLHLDRLLTLLRVSTLSNNPSSTNCLKVITSKNGNLMCSTTNDDEWLYHVRVASNCFEQNLIAYPVAASSNSMQCSAASSSVSGTVWSVHYLVTRYIQPGEELCFWPWFGLCWMIGIPPFLSPNNILNDHCYVCHQCGNSYSQPNPLKIHLVLACSKRIVNNIEQNGSNNHHNNHSNNKKTSPPERRLHSCTFCGKVYTRKYGLKIHIRTHTGVKPLSCRYCGRSFSDPSNLNKHMRLHAQHLIKQQQQHKSNS